MRKQALRDVEQTDRKRSEQAIGRGNRVMRGSPGIIVCGIMPAHHGYIQQS
jgi:hypothetical protein